MTDEQRMLQVMAEYPMLPPSITGPEMYPYPVIQRLHNLLFRVRQELIINANDLSEAIRLRQATKDKLAFLRSVLRRMNYDPNTRSTRTGPNAGVPVLIPWVLTQMRRERSNLAMNDETRRVFRRTIAARKSDEFQLVREIHKRTESDKAFKLRFNALVEEEKRKVNITLLNPAAEENTSAAEENTFNNAGPSNT